MARGMEAERNSGRRRRTAAFLAVAGCALASVLPAAASAAPVPSTSSDAGPGYWTPERMREAETVDPPLTTAFPDPGAPVTRAAGAARGPALTIPAAGGGAAPFSARAPRGRASRAYESGEVADPTGVGTRTHGRLFFTVPGEGNAACSGTAIRSNRRSLVLTAGHCVHGGGHQGEWFRNVVFVPAYERGDAPFGVWQATRLYATPIWVEFGDPTGDIAVIATKPNNRGKLQSVVGARGIGFGRDPAQRYTALGYPANPDDGFDGEQERFCRSGFAGRDATGGYGPRTISIECDMTQGASGGGWLTESSSIASLTSYGYPDLEDVIFGPYLGSLARELYEATQIRCRGEVATIVGTGGGDRIEGTKGKDVIAAAAGADTVLASPKDDVVCGGPGADGIDGGSGGDELLGGGGDDSLIGGSGTDRCSGGDGRNEARGCERSRNTR